MRTKLRQVWEDLQTAVDLHGGTWLALFTTAILLRVIAVLKGYPALTMSEATAYSAAIGSLAYSNKGDK